MNATDGTMNEEDSSTITASPSATPKQVKSSTSKDSTTTMTVSAASAPSAPTRASLLTGRTPARSCIHDVEQHILCRATQPGEDRLTPGQGGCLRGTWSLANATNAASSSYLSGFYGKWHLGSLSNRSGSGDCYEVDGGSNCLEGYMRFGADHRGSQASCCQGVDALSWPGNPHFTNRALGISHPLHFGFTEFVATPQCGAYVLTTPSRCLPPLVLTAAGLTARC